MGIARTDECNIIIPIMKRILHVGEKPIKCRNLLVVLTLGVLVFFTGCVSLNQEIIIREDGSGVLQFAVGVDSQAYERFQSEIPEGFEMENLFAPYALDENITAVTFDQYEADGKIWDVVRMEMADFITAQGERRRIGPVTFYFTEEEDQYSFFQSIDMGATSLNIPGVNLLDLSRSFYSVQLTAPQILATNGVQPSVGVSTWSISLEEMLQDESVTNLRAVYSLEPFEGVFIPWEVLYPYVTIGFLSLGGISVLVVIIFNTAGRKEEETTLKFDR